MHSHAFNKMSLCHALLIPHRIGPANRDNKIQQGRLLDCYNYAFLASAILTILTFWSVWVEIIHVQILSMASVLCPSPCDCFFLQGVKKTICFFFHQHSICNACQILTWTWNVVKLFNVHNIDDPLNKGKQLNIRVMPWNSNRGLIYCSKVQGNPINLIIGILLPLGQW